MRMRKRANYKRGFEFVVLIAGGLMLIVGFVSCSGPAVKEESTNDQSVATEQSETNTESTIAIEQAGAETAAYTQFQHSNPAHARMPCLLCHTREDNSAALKFPGHVSCAGCHKQQFDDSGSLMCAICHTNAEAGELKRFPSLRSFNVRFDHARHLREANCATCHTPSRRGVALSIPKGTAAHTTCFQCHSPQAEAGGQDIASCSTCHESGRPSRTSESAPAFAKGFSHSDHRGAQRLNCSSCHTVRAGMPRGRQVTAPTAIMHLPGRGAQNCATCHNGKRAFGGTDFADCKRCHEGSSFSF